MAHHKKWSDNNGLLSVKKIPFFHPMSDFGNMETNRSLEPTVANEAVVDELVAETVLQQEVVRLHNRMNLVFDPESPGCPDRLIGRVRQSIIVISRIIVRTAHSQSDKDLFLKAAEAISELEQLKPQSTLKLASGESGKATPKARQAELRLTGLKFPIRSFCKQVVDSLEKQGRNDDPDKILMAA